MYGGWNETAAHSRPKSGGIFVPSRERAPVQDTHTKSRAQLFSATASHLLLGEGKTLDAYPNPWPIHGERFPMHFVEPNIFSEAPSGTR
jgi:hypothetical protein